MARKPKAAGDTKDALAQALLKLLLDGKTLSSVRVKELTDACGLDRQTFYYHFKNMSEAAQYIYERELRVMFEDEGISSLEELNWKTRIGRMLMLIDEKPHLHDILVPVLGDSALRKKIYSLIYAELEKELLPHLLETGMDSATCEDRASYLTYMLESVLMAWLNREVELDVPIVLDRIDEMMRDYVAGVRQRIQGQSCAQA